MEVTELNLDALDLKYEKLSIRRDAVERKLLASLGETGQQSPVIVVRGGAGRYIIIDGHKRVRALKRLKADVARAAVWELSEGEALAASYQLTSQGGRNAFEEGWLVAELHRVFMWNLREVGARLVRSKSWVSRRLSLVEELPDWMAEEVAQGRIGAHAAANYLVPLTRGNSAAGRELAENIRGLGLTNRQIGAICMGYRAASRETRRKIVAEPAMFLKARAAAGRDGALSEKGNHWLKSIELIGNVSLGLTRILPETLHCEGTEAEKERLGAAWAVSMKRFAQLSKTASAVGLDGGR
ncbi:MAG: ParB N-terminal domain-containing protein [bacterium]